ncbi:MAG: cysteine hydrolase [Bifidobacteriaceae bacterium]|jgi:nicotinamidase-related amidase|nr:cysteine hydrolase [Bifidobacteriaceae bacterium]
MSTTQLVVIDMQNVFGADGSQWQAPRFGEIVEPVRELAEAFAPNVVFTRFISAPQPTGAWVPYYQDWPFALQPASHPMWDVVPELADVAGRVRGVDGQGETVDKPTFSKWGPELAGLLGPEGRMVLVGVSTDCCVISTALAAADAGVEVLVVAEACTGVDDPSHQAALHVMGLYGPIIKVVSMSDALALVADAEPAA